MVFHYLKNIEIDSRPFVRAVLPAVQMPVQAHVLFDDMMSKPGGGDQDQDEDECDAFDEDAIVASIETGLTADDASPMQTLSDDQSEFLRYARAISDGGDVPTKRPTIVEELSLFMAKTEGACRTLTIFYILDVVKRSAACTETKKKNAGGPLPAKGEASSICCKITAKRYPKDECVCFSFDIPSMQGPRNISVHANFRLLMHSIIYVWRFLDIMVTQVGNKDPPSEGEWPKYFATLSRCIEYVGYHLLGPGGKE